MRTLRITALALLVMGAAASAHAFTIHGTIANGTTGSTNIDAKITVVEPSAGMKEVATVEAHQGHFEIQNLDNAAPVYLLRTDYAGVSYNTPVQVTGQDQTVAVEVFESTSSWDGVAVVMPHIAAVRGGNALHIEQLYEITNDSAPKKTLTAKDGAFRFYLPADMDSLTDCTVSAIGMPIKRMPLPTDTPDIYTIDYPIRPGVTRISVTYSVPYATGSYTLKEKVLQPVAHVMEFAVDSTMQVTSSSHTFATQESVHGMNAYALHDIPEKSEVMLTFAGGDPNFAGIDVEGDENQPAANENIRVVPGDEQTLSIFLMCTVLLVMAGIIAMSLRDRHDPLSDPKVLRAHYSLLLSRLARLDDLHAAQTVPDDAYRASREELMGRLAVLALQLRSHGGVHAPDAATISTPKSRVQ